jgi:predicted amidohydrolase
VHLWGAENLFFEAGDLGVPVWKTEFGRMAVAICYDGWFPETYRLAALQGADILCVPTNWVPMPDQPANTLVMANILAMGGAHSNSMYVAAITDRTRDAPVPICMKESTAAQTNPEQPVDPIGGGPALWH